MRGLWTSVWLLAGCDLVFGIERHDPGEADPPACFGRSGSAGLLEVCAQPPSPAWRQLASVDTGGDDAPGDCMQIVTQRDVDDTEVCILIAESIELAGTFEVTGRRPLVLVAATTLAIDAAIDVSARALAPGAGGVLGCPVAGTSGGSSGGGGAGGTFGGIGGTGGGNDDAGSAPPPQPLGFVRGGCDGGRGGTHGGVTAAAGGRAGGAIYLIAGERITVRGSIDASGGGGEGGKTNSITGGGGAGGGSGGLIGLDAPSIVLEAGSQLVANGGGGGGGGGSGANATAGGPGGRSELVGGSKPFGASGGAGGSGSGTGAVGGAGGHRDAMAMTGGFAVADAGHGGGGGGAGSIKIFTTDLQDRGAVITPSFETR